MTFGHEQLDVYRIVAMLTRLGQRGYTIGERPADYGLGGSDTDTDSDPDADKS